MRKHIQSTPISVNNLFSLDVLAAQIEFIIYEKKRHLIFYPLLRALWLKKPIFTAEIAESAEKSKSN